jgi:hypothetical protein
LGRAKGCRRCCSPGNTGHTGSPHRSDKGLVFVLVRSLGLVQEVVVLEVGLESLQEVNLLGVLPLVVAPPVFN